ncbi:response regulator [Pseudomonas sp. NA13]
MLDALPAAPPVETEALVPVRALSILVVDDYPANRLLLSQQLGYLGHRVQEAQNGVEGLHAWRSEHFDVVITDCNMPLMSGYELARAIRDEERAQNLSPGVILGFTANAQAEERTAAPRPEWTIACSSPSAFGSSMRAWLRSRRTWGASARRWR